MPRFEVSWQAFGVLEVDIDDEDMYVLNDIVYDAVHNELGTVNYDGLDWDTEVIEE